MRRQLAARVVISQPLAKPLFPREDGPAGAAAELLEDVFGKDKIPSRLVHG
ncbi:MAG: hypothetical protein ABSG03_26620 [Bryobacteraceae bacterium]